MKFICKKNELVQAISIVSKAVSSKPQTPILSGIYIKAEGNKVELHATNQEIGIICNISADIEVSGDIVVSGRYAQEVIRKLPGENVTIEYDRQEKIVKINSNSTNFTLLSMSPNDFPVISILESDMKFSIRDNVLKNLINMTAFSCSNDESRPIFTGCLMEINDNSIIMAATNTHRLAFKEESIDGFTGTKKLIIPSKVLGELVRCMTSEIPSEVLISCTSNNISFSYENIYISSRLIEGQFPDYRRVMPIDFATRVTLSTAEFSAAVDRVALISRTNDYKTIKMDFELNSVRISSNNPDVGFAEEIIPALIDGNDTSISFNAIYINDVMKVISSDKFYICLNKSLDPAGIKQEDDESFKYIITPVRS